MSERAAPTTPRWLNTDEAEAWRGILAIVQRAFPEIERDLRTHDLLAVHYHILVALSAARDNTMRLAELADSANLSPSRLTHRIGLLVDRGEVDINQDPDDGRAKRATLTAVGRRRLEHVAPHHVETVRRVIFDHLSADQTVALADALAPVANSLVDHPEYLNPGG
jgi:DNA-binding MarR family transcriptional regulator